MAKGDLTSDKYSGTPATGGTVVKAAAPADRLDYITGIKIHNNSTTQENLLTITIGGTNYPYYVPTKGFITEGDLRIPVPTGESVSATNTTINGCNLLLTWAREELV